MRNEAEEMTSETQETGLIKALWRTFSSMKTAIVLLLVLAIASVIGTLITQGLPAEFYNETYGPTKAWIINRFGLGNLYHSPGYVLLLTLVGINLAVCSINRFGIAWRRTFRPKVNTRPGQIAGMQRSQMLSAESGVEDAAAEIVTALRSGSYHVVSEEDGADVVLHASRGRLGIWGPYLTHVSVLVIFLGALLGGRLGFSGFANILEGGYTDTYGCQIEGEPQTRPLGFRVALDRFAVERDDDLNPTGYKSALRVLEGGKVVARKVIDVNHPLTYKGISFLQSSYGPVFVVSLRNKSGETARAEFPMRIVETPDGPKYQALGESWAMLEAGERSITVFLHDLAPARLETPEWRVSSVPGGLAAQVMLNDRLPEYKGLDAWTDMGMMGPGDSADYKGIRVTADMLDYAGLQVERNPALPVVYVGFGLMLLGVFISFYVTHKTVRVRLSPAETGGTVLHVGAVSKSEPSAFDRDFEKLRSYIEGKE